MDLKQAKNSIRRGLSRTWEHISEGWHEMVQHSSDALTRFTHRKGEEEQARESGGAQPAIRRWGLVAGELEETDKEFLVRLEVPGVDKQDCEVTIDGNMLYMKGEKRFERTNHDSTYHVMERVYGVFERVIPLPGNVDPDRAEASCKNGVLTVHLPKLDSGKGRLITLSDR